MSENLAGYRWFRYDIYPNTDLKTILDHQNNYIERLN